MWIAAAAAVAVGVLLALRATTDLKDFSTRIGEYEKLARKLQDLQADADRGDMAIAEYEKMTNTQAVAIVDVLKQNLPEDHFQVHELTGEQASMGWTVKRSEAVFTDIEMPKLATGLTALEAGRPPWRVVEFAIDSAGQEGGRVGASVVLETLEKPRGGLFKVFSLSPLRNIVKDSENAIPAPKPATAPDARAAKPSQVNTTGGTGESTGGHGN